MRIQPFLVVVSVALAPSCAHTPTRAPANASAEPWSAPPLQHAVSVRDGRTGERIGLDDLHAALARAEVVFVGETHIDETTHAVELAVYEALLARRGGRVVLALEMFERDVQPVLDRYLRGEIDEPAFLRGARPWSNHRTAYRPLIELAKAHGAPVVASNFPATWRRRVATGGLEALSPEERALAPAELLANTPAYWRRVDNAIRGHAGMMGPAPAPDDARLTSAQSLWDNAMGDACARALRQHPGHVVLHVNGGFHSEYWDGTVRQLLLRAPGTRVATVAVVPTANPATAELGGVPFADFVVFAEERAQDVDEGTYAVFVPRELEYRLHVPSGASDDARVPLLVWLVDDGESAEDALRLWRGRIGDVCAIAVIEPPYRELQDDLAAGGRWFWPASFRPDIGALREGLERAWAFVLRRQPIDPARVCLAGEGTGATVVAATTMLSGRLAVDALAFEPRRFAPVRDFPLPLPELRGDRQASAQSLRVAPRPADEAWWGDELGAYRGVGLDAQLAPPSGDAWSAELGRENAVRAALGLAPREIPAEAARAHVRVDGPRARSWARLLADERARRDGERIAILDASSASAASSREIALDVRPQDLARPGRLPTCPGAFGGTTVLVLPEDLTPEDRAAWRALEADDPLAKTSRFHRLVLADASGERELPVVLAELAEKKRTNVLVVPATWCADGAVMRALRRSVRDLEDRMTIHWRPGLGGM